MNFNKVNASFSNQHPNPATKQFQHPQKVSLRALLVTTVIFRGGIVGGFLLCVCVCVGELLYVLKFQQYCNKEEKCSSLYMRMCGCTCVCVVCILFYKDFCFSTGISLHLLSRVTAHWVSNWFLKGPRNDIFLTSHSHSYHKIVWWWLESKNQFKGYEWWEHVICPHSEFQRVNIPLA